MMITHKLEMDLQQRSNVQRIEVVQGDRNARQMELTLLSGGCPWAIPEDVRVNLRYCKADGTGGWYSQWPEGVDCWNFQENVLTVLLAPPVMTAEGMVFLQIELEQDEDLLATFAVQVYVERNVASRVLESDNFVDRPRWMTAQLNKWLEEVKESKTFVHTRYADTPLRRYDLPQDEFRDRYSLDDGGNIFVMDNIGKFSPITKCPRYLGWKLEEGSQIYLYIGDLVNGKFRLDENYIVHVHDTKDGRKLVNFLQSPQNRFIVTDGSKYFCYRISENKGVEIVGCDSFPVGETEAMAYVPDEVSDAGSHVKNGDNYGIVLPGGCSYAVLVKDSEEYGREDFNVSSVASKGTTRISNGVSFGQTPEDGAVLLTVPGKCDPEDLTIYLSKQVKAAPAAARGRRAREVGRRLIRDLRFTARKSILRSDSALPLKEGKRFFGMPYSSRWVNAHYVGFEVSVETMRNAMEDPYSVFYDGADVSEEDGVKKWQISGNSEIPEAGGPGYGLVCSAFATLIYGNPYPQTIRGFTFDENFRLRAVTDVNAGMMLVKKDLSHCAFVDEVYDSGYALYEATDPCVAKTVHTAAEKAPSGLGKKTAVGFLDEYLYAVTNLDDSGYGETLLKLENPEIPQGAVRPWRGHKSVYGPWDREGAVGDYTGSGIGVTIHPTEEHTREGSVPLTVTFVPYQGSETNRVEVLNTIVPTDAGYWNIADAVRASGTYSVSCGDGNVEKFRYYDHGPVTLRFDGKGRAVFSDADVLYAYVRVKGYGGSWGKVPDDDEGPMVIAAGRCYPELAANPGRIKAVYAAIVKDPEEDSWGKYSVVCGQNVDSDYNTGTGGGGAVQTDGLRLADSVTGKDYEVSVIDGKLTMKEV